MKAEAAQKVMKHDFDIRLAPSDDEQNEPAPLPPYVRLVRDYKAWERWLDEAAAVRDDDALVALVAPQLRTEEVEVMLVVLLDGKSKAMAVQEIARGGRHGCAITAREVFRLACAMGASAVALSHNHPSGDPTPSPQDVALTDVVRAAGEVVGITLVDHLIVGARHHWSMCAHDWKRPAWLQDEA